MLQKVSALDGCDFVSHVFVFTVPFHTSFSLSQIGADVFLLALREPDWYGEYLKVTRGCRRGGRHRETHFVVIIINCWSTNYVL